MIWELNYHKKLTPEMEQKLQSILPKEALAAVRSVRDSRYDMQPFLLDDAGHPETIANAFFASRSFRSYAATTRKKHALSIRLWLNFCAARDIRWIDAGCEIIADFKFWRMTDQANPARVAGGAVHCAMPLT